MYLYGASGHARVIIDIIQSSTSYEIQGLFDDYSSEESMFSIPVLKDNSILSPADKLIISIGNNQKRKSIATRLEGNFITAIHKTAIISQLHTVIGAGSVVMPSAVVNANTTIGKHCIINTGSIIEHDCTIENYVHISPNAALAGGVTVGEGTQIGIGANVIPNVTIGKWAIIGAGSTVLSDVPDNCVYVGSPAKFIKKIH